MFIISKIQKYCNRYYNEFIKSLELIFIVVYYRFITLLLTIVSL